MADSVCASRPPNRPAACARPRTRGVTLALQATFLLVECLLFIWLIDRLADADWVRAVCPEQLVLAVAAASLSLYCARGRRHRIYDPLHQMETLLPRIRCGELPMDELSLVGGRLAPLARQVQEMLRELKSQKSTIAEAEREVRQRIANRTDALERKIGTLRQQATRDSLTGLLNRRALDDHLARVAEECVAKGRPLGVLMIDVDNFKPLNDTLGHAAGDELLRSIGQILRSTLRDADAAFRCGGDEFVVVLEGADAKGARILADRLTSLVDGLARTVKVAAPPRLSIGAACWNELPSPSSEALLQEADARLYAVKSGRKRLPRLPAGCR